MKKIFLLLILSVLVYTNAQSQNSHAERMPWVKGQFPPKNNNFDYMVARGSGNTISEARDNAFNDLLIELGNNVGIKVSSSTISDIKSQLNFDGKKEEYSEGNTTVSSFKIDREGFGASFSKVDEYYERTGNRYELWALYEVSSSGKSFKPYIPEYTDKYGMRAGWRSMLVPGWGQFYKGKVGKGVMFLTTEVVAVSGVVVCEIMRSNNMRKSQETTNLKIVKEYRKRADDWELGRNIGIGLVGGIYLWNVLDAALAKGKIRYAWIPKNMHLSCSQEKGYYYYGIAYKF